MKTTVPVTVGAPAAVVIVAVKFTPWPYEAVELEVTSVVVVAKLGEITVATPVPLAMAAPT